MMENLNSDIVLEILTRLPKTDIKSILQCRKVCTLWRSLLGKPKRGMLFAHKSMHFGLDFELLFRERSSVTKIGTAPFDFYFDLVGSCNGLVCYKSGIGGSYSIYIFNPLTGERIRVPKMGRYVQCVGFGYCHSTGTYKVVNTCYIEDGKQNVQVYTLGDGSGCREKPEITYRFREGGESGVFANGALHWLDINCYIVAFDLADETFRSLPSPPLCNFASDSYINVTLEGNLCLCLPYTKQSEPMILDIWVFKMTNLNNCLRSTRTKEHTNFNSFTWIKVLSIKRSSISRCHLYSLTESEIMLWETRDVLSCYDTTTFKRLWRDTGPRLTSFRGFPHMNSLVSLKDLGEELVEI